MNSDHDDQSIAVIGMSGRFPGASNVDTFWKNLINNRETIARFSEEELLKAGFSEKLIKHPNYVNARGNIGNPNDFDADFFDYSPREAELIDPQHRVFLECAWHTLEDAGYVPRNTSARIGIIGSSGSPWHFLEIYRASHLKDLIDGMALITSNDKDYLSSRIAYKLNLTGECLTVQSACSSSLVAVILGMQSLLEHQSDMILAGGVSIHIPENHGYIYVPGSLDSIDGKCRAFDENATGTVFSSGSGMILLKRLPEALADKDNIYCIIRGGAINNDGSNKVSFTAPSIQGQVEVETAALELAEVDPLTIRYVEAHGTGTKLGDPIEIAALTQTFRQYTEEKQFCAIGSVKSNIGHTDTASGVISLMKASLVLKNQMIPASINYETPNSEIDFPNSPFYVQENLTHWQNSLETPRRALVNSFGVGGTNACLVLEEAPFVPTQSTKHTCYLLPLSAKNTTSLEMMHNQFLDFLEENPNINLTDLCYTMQVGREAFKYRSYIVFQTREELIEQLRNKNYSKPIITDGSNSQTIFMFPGQGNQYYKMGAELYQNEPFFKTCVDECSDFLQDKLAYVYDLRDFITNKGTPNENDINNTLVAQPALFTIEYSLAKLLISWGIKPTGLVGHSIGEFVAACIAGVFSIEEALTVIATRAKLAQELPKGSMLAIFAHKDQVREMLIQNLEIAVVNSPSIVVVSGPTAQIDAFVLKLEKQNIQSKKLDTSHAFHSAMVDPVVEPLRKLIESCSLKEPEIPILSTVTGKWLSEAEAMDPKYWALHARLPVEFSKAMTALSQDPNHLYLEVGPGHSLESNAKSHDIAPHRVIGTMQSVREMKSECTYLRTALGKLWQTGAFPTWNEYYKNEKHRRISLPGYAFDRHTYALDFNHSISNSHSSSKDEKLHLDDWFHTPLWKQSLALDDLQEFELKSNDCWVLFGYDNLLHKQLVKKLTNKGQLVYSVFPGQNFSENGDNSFQIEFDNLHHFERVLKEIRQSRTSSLHVLYLLPMTGEIPFAIDSLNKAEKFCFEYLILIEQALLKVGHFDILSLTIGTSELAPIHATPVNPFKSLTLGPCKVFNNENPTSTCRIVDFSLQELDEDPEFIAEQLIYESLHTTNEFLVAYCHRSRWIPSFQQIKLDPKTKPRRMFKDNGVYLIPGGLGGIGLSIATSIAKTAKTTLILTHRSSFPPRDEWENYLELHGENDPKSTIIKNLQLIDSQGTNIILKQTDVSNLTQMRELVKDIIEDHLKIDGVIHCAGVPGGGIIPLKSIDSAKEVMDPKVRGTLILHAALNEVDLDFFILCSSITSILGESGQVDYCSANAFMDAFAHHLNYMNPGLAISMNWDKWDKIGMAVKALSSNVFHSQPVDVAHKKELPYLLPLSSEDTQKKYQVGIDPDTDWFINSHLINKIPTLVGTAYFHFILEFAKSIDQDKSFKISNFQFFSPVMFLPASSRALKLHINPEDGKYLFTFLSHPLSIVSDQVSGQEHSSGTLTLIDKKPKESIDLKSIMERLDEETNDTYNDFLDESIKIDSILSLGPRWKLKKKIYKSENEWLAFLALQERFVQDVDAMPVHPALVDIALSYALSYATDALHLPLGYEEVSIFEPLGASIYSHIKTKSHNLETGIITLDITIANASGDILMLVKGYSLKRVAAHPNTKKKPSTDNVFFEHAILPEEGIEAFLRVFNQFHAPQVIISAKKLEARISDNMPSLEPESKSIESLALYPRPQISTEYIEPENEIQKMILDIWQKTLGIESIGAHDNFLELGGNSLTAIQIVSQIVETFKVNFTVEVFYQHPTIATIENFIAEQLVQQLAPENIEQLLSGLEE